MFQSWPRGRLVSLQFIAWTLVAIQVPLTGSSVWSEVRARWQFRQRWAKAQQEGSARLPPRPTPGNPGLKVGMHVGSLPVKDANGALIDLLKTGKGRRAILFVSDCGPCVSHLIREYEKLWRAGLPISVIARTPADEIAPTRRELRWELPIYSDYKLGDAADNCRIVYRPAALVVDDKGRVVYAQGEEDDQIGAASRVKQALLEESKN